MTTGTLMAMAVAGSRLQFGAASEKNAKMPRGSVRMGADEIIVSAYRYSSQARMKVNTAVATIPGTAGGSPTSMNARHRLAPSSLAEISMSGGAPSKNPLSSQMSRGRLKVRYPMISDP